VSGRQFSLRYADAASVRSMKTLAAGGYDVTKLRSVLDAIVQECAVIAANNGSKSG
jgi:hypothetical protein